MKLLRTGATVVVLAILAILFGIGAVAAIAGLSGCAKRMAIEPPPAVMAGDASDDCARACAKLAANHCPAGENPACASVCRNDQAQGVASQLTPSCIIDATTVPAIVACGASCP